jgi:F-type H+-transporting ATPase subunit gamma
MAKARALDKRRKSIRNIRKITRTMELIATAKFKKAMDRAAAAIAYTKRVTRLLADLANAGLKVKHPLLEPREKTERAVMLVLTANRGLCGGYNGSIIRMAMPRLEELKATVPNVRLEVSGKRGISAFRFRRVNVDETFTQFEDQPKFEEVLPIANRYLEAYARGELDRLDVVYTKFFNSAKQAPVIETLLPLTSLTDGDEAEAATSGNVEYEFLPSAESILEEVVPSSFRVKLFKCFLDAAVSEQIARMVAMKSATKSASDMIKSLSTAYNRARQSQITGEIMEILGGVEALKQ